MSSFAWAMIVGIGSLGVLLALMFRNAAMCCWDEHEAGERRRLREEDATPE